MSVASPVGSSNPDYPLSDDSLSKTLIKADTKVVKKQVTTFYGNTYKYKIPADLQDSSKDSRNERILKSFKRANLAAEQSGFPASRQLLNQIERNEGLEICLNETGPCPCCVIA